MTTYSAHDYISALNLQPHPEGGYFKETYRAQGIIKQNQLSAHFTGDRHYSTSILFLLIGSQYSKFHKINQDELWYFHAGSPLLLHVISPDGDYHKVLIGSDIFANNVLQYTVPAQSYFAAEVADKQKDSFTLVGCNVAPGFDFDDFVMPSVAQLKQTFPAKSFSELQPIIERLGYKPSLK